MAGNGNDALEWKWSIRYLDDKSIKAVDVSKSGNRKDYKRTVKMVHRNGGLARIWIKANSIRAKRAAMNIFNDETLPYGVRPVWRSTGEYTAVCRCRRMTVEEVKSRLRKMSPQDLWEPVFRKLCEKYSVKLTHKYAYRRPEVKDRQTTRRRPKSILVSIGE
jgi:hypothetical protein